MSTKHIALTAACAAALAVAAPAASPADDAGPDTAAPAISKLKRHGGRLTFRLSEAAKVNIVVARLRSTDRARYLRRTGHSGRNRVRIPRGLPAGEYRSVVVATDEAGNRSQRDVQFRIA